MFTNKEPSVIKRLQAHNIIACSYKTVEKTVILIRRKKLFKKFKIIYLSLKRLIYTYHVPQEIILSS